MDKRQVRLYSDDEDHVGDVDDDDDGNHVGDDDNDDDGDHVGGHPYPGYYRVPRV